MATTLEELETLAMKLPLKERSELAHRLIVSIDRTPAGTPEEIARAWDEEIARRAWRTWKRAARAGYRQMRSWPGFAAKWKPPRAMRVSLSDEASADADAAVD